MKALSFDDISLVPRYSNIASRRDVNTDVRFGNLTLRIPVFSANMDTITGPRMARKMYELGGLGFLHRFCSVEDNVLLYEDITKEPCNYPGATLDNTSLLGCEAVVSLGVNEGLDRFHALYEVGARYFCIDVAHGHSESVGDMIKRLKEFSDDTFIVAGNVCEPVGASYLADKGADAIKVGIGPGSACSTRIKTGFGVPQFSAIRDCRRVNCFLIADGGIRTPGDAVKAFVAG
jgi:IMP dehydrogenase